MTPSDPPSAESPSADPPLPGGSALTSRGFRITVDDGRESFYALSIEDPDGDGSWLMSDTAVDLDAMR